MSLADTLIRELEQEAKATRALLARVPDSQLAWKPHAKSRTLGQLANHVAGIPGWVAQLGEHDTVDAATLSPPPDAETAAGILTLFEEGAARAKAILAEMDDSTLLGDWSLTKDGKPVKTVPRTSIFRYNLLNHLYHHRGQLSVYLRLLDVPLPPIYGPTADENPFG